MSGTIEELEANRNVEHEYHITKVDILLSQTRDEVMKFSRNSKVPKISNYYRDMMKERIEAMRNDMRDWIRAARGSAEQAAGHDAGTAMKEENQAVEPSTAGPASSSETDVTQPSEACIASLEGSQFLPLL